MDAFQRRRIMNQRFALAALQDSTLEAEAAVRDAAPSQAVEAAVLGAVEAAPSEVVEAAPYDVAKEDLSEVVELASPDILEAAEPDAVEAAPAPEPAKRRAKGRKRRKPARASREIVVCRRRTACSLPKPELTPLERHERKCIICKHPERESIEEDFLQWAHPDYITDSYQLNDYHTIYRHAKATGLMQQRTMNLRFACESVVEHSANVIPSADALLRAIRMCTRINNRGEWHEPPSHVIVSSGGRINVDNRSVILQPSPESSASQPIAIPASSLISNRE